MSTGNGSIWEEKDIRFGTVDSMSTYALRSRKVSYVIQGMGGVLLGFKNQNVQDESKLSCSKVIHVLK